MQPMSRPFRHLVLLAACLLAVALFGAGCGGGASDDDYEQGLERVQSHLDEASAASRASGETTDVEERRAKLGEAAEAIQAAATEAEELEPPDDAADEHEALAEALQEYADVFVRLAKMGANDPAETEVYSQAGEVAERLDKASRDLEEAGYAVSKDEGE